MSSFIQLPHVPRLVEDSRGAKRIVSCLCGWKCPPDEQNSDDAFALHTVTPTPTPHDYLGRMNTLKHVLAQQAIIWARADQEADQRSADLERVQAGDPAEIEAARVAFHLADQRAQRCEEDLDATFQNFRQAARDLAASMEDLEIRPPVDDPVT